MTPFMAFPCERGFALVRRGLLAAASLPFADRDPRAFGDLLVVKTVFFSGTTAPRGKALALRPGPN